MIIIQDNSIGRVSIIDCYPNKVEYVIDMKDGYSEAIDGQLIAIASIRPCEYLIGVISLKQTLEGTIPFIDKVLFYFIEKLGTKRNYISFTNTDPVENANCYLIDGYFLY